MAYGEIARTLALRLKYGRRMGLARLAADHIARSLPDDMTGWTIVPVPLHRRRLWSRGFNQAMLIAGHIARDRDLPVAIDWIVRVKATPPLRGLGKAARGAQMRGAFAVPSERREALRGAQILLVDDVYASGATTGMIARTLKRAGAQRVVVACWSRVVHDENRGQAH
jgi:ComF family protein